MHIFSILFFALLTISYGGKMAISFYSPSFENAGIIPSKHTCDGSDVSPRLIWSNLPVGTKSIALICDDPDAPVGTWVHWVVYNIPPKVTELPENQPRTEKLPNGAFQGKNSWGKIGYGGPCPPSGIHRYFFKLFALDILLNLKPGATKEELLKEMQGHILGHAEFYGKYSRKR